MLLILPPFYLTGLSLDSILWDLSLSPAPSVYSSVLHTPLSLPTRVLATQSINSHLKDQRPPNSSLKCACLLVLFLHSPCLSFLTPSNFLKEWHGRVVQGKAYPEAVVRLEVMNILQHKYSNSHFNMQQTKLSKQIYAERYYMISAS